MVASDARWADGDLCRGFIEALMLGWYAFEALRDGRMLDNFDVRPPA